MALYNVREVTVTRVEYLLPSGAAAGEVCKALADATADYRRRHRLPDDAPEYDDWLRVESRDNQIAVTFTIEEEK